MIKVVYQNLRKAEKQLRQGLENLIWKTYGRLTRQQLFPVAYVLWQWIRLNCLRVSHIANLVMVYKNKGTSQRFTLRKGIYLLSRHGICIYHRDCQ